MLIGTEWTAEGNGSTVREICNALLEVAWGHPEHGYQPDPADLFERTKGALAGLKGYPSDAKTNLRVTGEPLVEYDLARIESSNLRIEAGSTTDTLVRKLPENLWKEFRKQALEEGVSANSLIAKAMESYLSETVIDEVNLKNLGQGSMETRLYFDINGICELIGTSPVIRNAFSNTGFIVEWDIEGDEPYEFQHRIIVRTLTENELSDDESDEFSAGFLALKAQIPAKSSE